MYVIKRLFLFPIVDSMKSKCENLLSVKKLQGQSF